MAGAHRRRPVAPGAHRRRGAGDEGRRPRRVAPPVVRPPRQPGSPHRGARRRWPLAATAALRRVVCAQQPLPCPSRPRTGDARRACRASRARAAGGRRRQADDPRADRHPRRSRARQPACAHEHRRRVARRRRTARGSSHRREAVPGNVRPPAAPGGEAGSAPGDEPLMSMLPVEPAYRLAERADEHRWLVTGLWSEQAVGIVGGEPKCCKSFLALDLAVSVASGAPCLRRFVVPKAGRVLLYAAEDALHIVRRRLDGIAVAAGAMLANLDIQVVTAPTVRLDLDADRRNLADTVARLLPRLLILDPFVRLHRIDENASGEVAPLLAYLRELQRTFQVAVLVVHHARKDANAVRPGQALRGSSELHGWGDSNLYMRRRGDQLTLSTEHRAAASQNHIPLQLTQTGSALALSVTNDSSTPEPDFEPSALQRVHQILAGLDQPVTVQQLRKLCALRTATVCSCLTQLADNGVVSHDSRGYQLKGPLQSPAVSLSAPIDPPGKR